MWKHYCYCFININKRNINKCKIITGISVKAQYMLGLCINCSKRWKSRVLDRVQSTTFHGVVLKSTLPMCYTGAQRLLIMGLRDSSSVLCSEWVLFPDDRTRYGKREMRMLDVRRVLSTHWPFLMQTGAVTLLFNVSLSYWLCRLKCTYRTPLSYCYVQCTLCSIYFENRELFVTNTIITVSYEEC